jgi:hypothetical protein
MQDITERDVDKLAKILGLLGSWHPAEAAAAAHKASEFVRSRGWQWIDVLKVPALPATAGYSGPRDNGGSDTGADDLFGAFGGWNSAVAFCLKHRKLVTKWELEFLTKVSSWHSISPKQRPILAGICDKITDQGFQP